MPSYIELDKQALFPSSSNAGKLILGVNTSGQATLTNSDGETTPIGGGGGGSSNAGGSDTQIQVNSGSSFLGTESFTFNYQNQSLQQGLNVIASGLYSHAEGAYTQAAKDYSHAEGYYNLSTGLFSHAEGLGTVAAGIGSKAEGIGISAYDPSSPFENIFDAFGLTLKDVQDNDLVNIDTPITSLTTLTATGDVTSIVTYPYRIPYLVINFYLPAQPYAVVLESATYNAGTDITTFTVSGLQQYYPSNVVDPTLYTLALGDYSHAEGESTKTYGRASHAEGFKTITSGSYSHAEGDQTQAIGTGSHAEGWNTKAIGISSHAEGSYTQAIGNYSHAEGSYTVASGPHQHVQGQYNQTSSAQSAFIIGNGTDESNRRNLVFAVGNTFQITGSLRVSGSLLLNGSSITGPISVTGSTLYSNSPAAGSNFNTTGSIFLGSGSGDQAANAQYSNFIGEKAGYLSTNVISSNFLGVSAGRQAANASYSIFAGNQTGFGARNAEYAVFMGNTAGWQAENSSGSIFIGSNAGYNAASASYSILIGYKAGDNGNSTSNGIKSNNIIIGTNITLPTGTNDSINLGGIIFATGSYSTTTGNPFSSSVVNAKVGIGTSTPQFTLDVSGSARVTNGLTITGSLRGFVSASTIASTTASIDLSRANFYTVTLVSGSNTHISASNIQPGQTTSIRVLQPNPGTGSVTFSSAFKQPSRGLYTPTNTSDAVDILTIISFDTANAYIVNVNNLI